MKFSDLLPAIVLIVCLFLAACGSAETPETRTVAISSTAIVQEEPQFIPSTYTPNAMTRQATATVTAHPTRTPFPTMTPSPEPVPPTPTRLLPTPSPTLTPSATPTLYPDGWVAGLLWDEARTTIYVGSSSVFVYDSRITYEPLNEAVAEEIAATPLGTLVVLYGDYIPAGLREGRMIVERVELVHLPYSEETVFSAVYTDPDNLYSFAYPEGWSLTADYNNSVSVVT